MTYTTTQERKEVDQAAAISLYQLNKARELSDNYFNRAVEASVVVQLAQLIATNVNTNRVAVRED